MESPVYEIEREKSIASESAIVVRVMLPSDSLEEDPLSELIGLAKTAGAQVVAGVTQRRDAPDVSTYLGKGKVEEVKLLVETHQADVVIFDNDLSPGQTRNLEKGVGWEIEPETPSSHQR